MLRARARQDADAARTGSRRRAACDQMVPALFHSGVGRDRGPPHQLIGTVPWRCRSDDDRDLRNYRAPCAGAQSCRRDDDAPFPERRAKAATTAFACSAMMREEETMTTAFVDVD